MLRCDICKHKVSDYFYLEEHMNHFHDNFLRVEPMVYKEILDGDNCNGVECGKIISCTYCGMEFKCLMGKNVTPLLEKAHKEKCGNCILK